MVRRHVVLSVCLSSVTYALWLNGMSYRKNGPKTQIGLPTCQTVTLWYQFGPPVTPHFPKRGYCMTAPPKHCIANCGQTDSISGMVTIDSL